jgi:oligoendopeptidase F
MKWDLTYLFKTEEDWKQSLEECMKYIPLAASFKGTLNDKDQFVKYLKLDLEISEKLERTYQYASLKSDLNKKNVENAKNLAMVQNFLMQLNQATSWVNPEILSLGKEKVMEYINSDEEIKQFAFVYEQLFHQNEHILDADSEQLISYFSPLFRKGNTLYSALSVSDNQAVEVELDDKEKVMVTQGSWRSLITDSKTASDRQKVFEAIFNYYEKHKTTYAEIYNGVLQTNVAKAKARKYDNVLESFLYGNNIPTSVFLNLVDVASNNNEALKKYIELRKKYLGLEKHYTYDRF